MTLQNVTQPLCFAHRGRNRIAPENTMAAFRAALDAGDHGIELDVTLSADGRLVVIHDDTVDRTTDGHGLVSDLSFQDLRRLDAGSWFSSDFTGERLPSLEEVLSLAKGRILVNVEIKSSAWRDREDQGIEGPVLALIEHLEMIDDVIISSFDLRILKRMRKLSPTLRIGGLAPEGFDPTRAVALASSFSAYSIHPYVGDLEDGLPTAYRDFSGLILPWTVKDQRTAKTLEQQGVQGYFVDLPFPDWEEN